MNSNVLSSTYALVNKGNSYFQKLEGNAIIYVNFNMIGGSIC